MAAISVWVLVVTVALIMRIIGVFASLGDLRDLRVSGINGITRHMVHYQLVIEICGVVIALILMIALIAALYGAPRVTTWMLVVGAGGYAAIPTIAFFERRTTIGRLYRGKPPQ